MNIAMLIIAIWGTTTAVVILTITLMLWSEVRSADRTINDKLPGE